MSETNETDYLTKARILSEVWMEYRNDEEFKDYVEYNDLGLPLAYAIDSGIIESTEMAENFISETFRLLLAGLDIQEDHGFETLEDIFELAEYRNETDLRVDDDEDEDEDEDDFTESSWELNRIGDAYDNGVAAERERVMAIVEMHKRWAKEKRDGKDFMFWESVGEVLTPVEIDEDRYEDD
jgi:Ran GTPase-activating protein (RanGAP) involved in mRNA processing and transport